MFQQEIFQIKTFLWESDVNASFAPVNLHSFGTKRNAKSYFANNQALVRLQPDCLSLCHYDILNAIWAYLGLSWLMMQLNQAPLLYMYIER